MFTNREIAIMIWVGLFIFYCLLKTDIRKPIKNIIKIAFSKKYIEMYFVIYAYIFFLLFILYKIKFWQLSLLKDTIIWLITIPVFSVIKASEENYKKYFLETLKECFEVYVLIEFIGVNYPFNIWIELIIIPIVLLLSLVGEFGEKFGGTKEVSTFAYIIVIIISVIAFIHSIRLAIIDIQNIFTIDTLKDICFIPILTIAYMPMTYLILVFMNYETIWFRINLKNYLSKKDKKRIMLKVIKDCKINLNKIKNIQIENILINR